MIVVQPVTEEEEGPVPPVVQLGNDDRSAERGVEVVILERAVGGSLIKYLPVEEILIDVPFFRGEVKFVGAALGGDVVRSTGGVADFGGNSRSPDLRLLKRVHGRSDQRVGVAQRGPQGPLGVDAVQRVTQLRLRLPQNVICSIVPRLGSFHVVHKMLGLGIGGIGSSCMVFASLMLPTTALSVASKGAEASTLISSGSPRRPRVLRRFSESRRRSA